MFLDSTQLLLFLAATVVLIVTPGPAVIYVITRSIAQGRLAGLASVLGVGLGNFGHAVAAALGLSAVLASSAAAFAVVKYLGAAYLIYLGIRKFVSAPAELAGGRFTPERLGSIFRQGVVVAVLNPKTALFFLALLPQFTAPERGSVGGQLLVLGSIVALLGVLSDSCYALLAGWLAAWLKRRAALRGEKYLSGTVYCGLGLATAFSGAGKSH